MKNKLIMAIALLIIVSGVQMASSMGPPPREPETVTAVFDFEPLKLNLDSGNDKIYVNISLDRYNVGKIDQSTVVLTTPDGNTTQGSFYSYYPDETNPISVKFEFDKGDVIDGLNEPEDRDTVPLTVTGDILSKWWDINFEGSETITIVDN